MARVWDVKSRKCRNNVLSSWLQLSLVSNSIAIDCCNTEEILGKGSEDLTRACRNDDVSGWAARGFSFLLLLRLKDIAGLHWRFRLVQLTQAGKLSSHYFVVRQMRRTGV